MPAGADAFSGFDANVITAFDALMSFHSNGQVMQ